MKQIKGVNQESSVSNRKSEFHRTTRQMELDSCFRTIRKEMLEGRCPETSSSQPCQVIPLVDSLIEGCESEFQNSMLRIWELTSSKLISLSQVQVKRLSSKMLKLNHKGADLRKGGKVAIFLIANWASAEQRITMSHQELLLFLLGVLADEQCSHLHKCVLYTLVNLCSLRQFSELLLGMNAIVAVMGCLSLNIEVISLFFKALIFSLPSQYKYEETTVSSLIKFLKQTFCIHPVADLKQSDCIAIISKLVVINGRIFKTMVLSKLQNEIESLIQNLGISAHLPLCILMFQLLKHIYEDPLDERSFLRNGQFMEKIWHKTQLFLVHLQEFFGKQQRQCSMLKEELWLFLNNFFRFDFRFKNRALIWLTDECLYGKNYEWDERTIQLVSPFLDFDRISALLKAKLHEYLFDTNTTLSMLSALHDLIFEERVDSQRPQQDNDLLKKLLEAEIDERDQIADLASRIRVVMQQKKGKSPFWESRKKLKLEGNGHDR